MRKVRPVNRRKKGAFKLIVEVMPPQLDADDDIRTQVDAYVLVRDITFYNGRLSFFFLVPSPKAANKDGGVNYVNILDKLPEETMLQYFDRTQEKWGASWCEIIIDAPSKISIIGQFCYINDKVVSSQNDFASSYYHQSEADKSDHNKDVEVEEQNNVVNIASHRDKNDKSD